GTRLARVAGVFAGERAELVDHGVDGVLQLEDLAAHFDRDLLGQIATRHGGRDFGDVTHLAGQIIGHQVHVVGQVRPGTGDARHLRLSAQLAFGANLARHAGHFAGEAVELVHHRVDGVLQLEDLALHVDGDLLGEVPLRHRGGHLGDVADLAGEVRGHRVHIVREVLPRAADPGDLSLATEIALGADFAG